jgi:hypothetical protein
MGAWMYVLMAVGVVAFGWWRSLVRSREIRALAKSCGLYYLGEALPPSLPMKGWPFASITSVWNVVDGDKGGKRLVAFDCRFGQGKTSWRRTVIAVKTEISNITASYFDSDLRIEQMDDWVFIYRPKGFALISWGQLTPIPELRACLESV